MNSYNGMFDTDILKSKCAFITGATGGIGEAIAFDLAKAGCNLFLTGTENNSLQNLANELSVFNITIDYASADLSNNDEVYSVIDKAREVFMPIDILINSAGIFPYKGLFETKDIDYEELMSINFKAPFIFMREFANDMVKREWGRIVNIGSSSSYSGNGETTLYCASKHALLGLSRSVHDELKEYNIKSICISPSSTQSKMGMNTKNQDYSTFLDPKDVAKYVVFAISNNSNIVTEEIFLKRMVVR